MENFDIYRFTGRANIFLSNLFYKCWGFFKFPVIRILSHGRINVHYLQPRFRDYDMEAIRGSLIIEKCLYTRKGFHLIVDKGSLHIGKNCFFNYNCSVTCLNHIDIKDGCTFGNNVVIVDHDHKKNGNGFVLGSVLIEEGTWVGANVVILRDTHIGRNCIIAAGSVVKGYVPDNTLYIQKRSSECKKLIQ